MHDRAAAAGLHANMAYTLAIYTHKSTGRDRGAAETVAGVLLGAGWSCPKCGAAYTPGKRAV